MKRVYVGLGSNEGDRAANLEKARSLMNGPSIRIIKASPVYETPAWGDTDQPPYLNQVVEVEVDMEPDVLLRRLQKIERAMGRRGHGWSAPRPIDLDILACGEYVLEGPDLRIPHPCLAVRGFVLVPLSRIAPDYVHPVNGKTVSEMLRGVDCDGIQVHSD